jgi:hypothetical protein
MACPSVSCDLNGGKIKADTAVHLEPGSTGKESKIEKLNFLGPPKFDDPYKERTYLKGRLAAAFRIFGKYGFDEGISGHITVRVSTPLNVHRYVIREMHLLIHLRTPSTQQPVRKLSIRMAAKLYILEH